MTRPPRLPALSLAGCLALATALAATPAAAWTQKTQLAIVETAAKLAPDDLARQIERHKAALREGVIDPFADHSGDRHETNADGSGRLREVLRAEARRAVTGIEGHRPFSEIVHQTPFAPVTASHPPLGLPDAEPPNSSSQRPG